MTIVLLCYSTSEVLFINLTPEEIKKSEEYDNFEEFLYTLQNRYSFRLKDCYWLVTDDPQVTVYKEGKEYETYTL